MEKEEVAGHGRLAEGRQAAGRRLRGREAGSTAAEVIQGEGEARLRAASRPGSPLCIGQATAPSFPSRPRRGTAR